MTYANADIAAAVAKGLAAANDRPQPADTGKSAATRNLARNLRMPDPADSRKLAVRMEILRLEPD